MFNPLHPCFIESSVHVERQLQVINGAPSSLSSTIEMASHMRIVKESIGLITADSVSDIVTD